MLKLLSTCIRLQVPLLGGDLLPHCTASVLLGADVWLPAARGALDAVDKETGLLALSLASELGYKGVGLGMGLHASAIRDVPVKPPCMLALRHSIEKPNQRIGCSRRWVPGPGRLASQL